MYCVRVNLNNIFMNMAKYILKIGEMCCEFVYNTK